MTHGNPILEIASKAVWGEKAMRVLRLGILFFSSSRVV